MGGSKRRLIQKMVDDLARRQIMIHYAVEILLDKNTEQPCNRDDWEKPNICSKNCDSDSRYLCWMDYLKQKVEQ